MVFSALTDPSVQLQLVGIRALTVLGSLQGWCLVSLGEAEGSVILFWETLCLWLLGHPCLLSVGAQKQWQHFIPGPSVPGILSLSLACFSWASCISGVWRPAALLLAWRRGKDGGQNSLWLRAGPLYDFFPGFLSPSDLELVVDHLIRLALCEEDSQSR